MQVAIDLARFALAPHILYRRERIGVQALIPQLAAERLHEAALGGLFGTDPVEQRTALKRPIAHRPVSAFCRTAPLDEMICAEADHTNRGDVTSESAGIQVANSMSELLKPFMPHVCVPSYPGVLAQRVSIGTAARTSGAPSADPKVVALAHRRQFSPTQRCARDAEADCCRGRGRLRSGDSPSDMRRQPGSGSAVDFASR